MQSVYVVFTAVFLAISGCKTSDGNINSQISEGHSAEEDRALTQGAAPMSVEARGELAVSQFRKDINRISTLYTNAIPDQMVEALMKEYKDNGYYAPSIFPELRKLARDRDFAEMGKLTGGTMMLEALLFKKFLLKEQYRFALFMQSAAGKKRFGTLSGIDTNLALDRLLVVTGIIQAHKGSDYYRSLNALSNESLQTAYARLDHLAPLGWDDELASPAGFANQPHEMYAFSVALLATEAMMANPKLP